ncbi:MAG: metallophosphoesterase [Myxococcota bacterium]
MAVRIAVIGDVHRRFDDRDVAWLDASDYDLILFVGDLAGYRQREGLQVARIIARLRKPALVLPGNHDGPHLLQLAAEVFGWGLAPHLGGRMHRRVARLERALAPVPLAGYSLHPRSVGGLDFTVLAARPHSFGGPGWPLGKYMRRRFGVRSMQDSADKLRALVDQAPHERLVLLAHNGPAGLGSTRDAIFGCDFRPEEGDWGDSDLQAAIDHARKRGKRVLAVAAGHMHHAVKGGGRRPTTAERDGTLHVNAARVPRIFRREGRVLRHHVRLELHEDHARAEERLVEL